jgi:hypothetical protein
VSRTSERRFWLLAPAIIGLLGCPTPTQYGGPIPIDTSGLEARTRILCRARPTQAADLCSPDKPTR